MTTQIKHTPGLYHSELKRSIETDGRIIGDVLAGCLAEWETSRKVHYQLVEACRAACAAASDCLPPSGEGELDAGYYKAKLLAIDEAASKCSAALALAEKGQE